MALVVHEPFDLDGKLRVRGDVLFGDEADVVVADPDRARKCSAVPDSDARFDHLRPKAKPAASNSGFMPEALPETVDVAPKK